MLGFVMVVGLVTLLCLSVMFLVPAWRVGSFRFVSPKMMAVGLSLVAVSFLCYGILGSPDLPDAPFFKRVGGVPLDALPPEALAALAEIHLIKHPTDAKGWRRLAPLYLSMGENKKAVQSYDYALSLGDFANPQEHALLREGLGVALFQLHGEILLPSAEEHLEEALLLDPTKKLSVTILTQKDLKRKQYDHAVARLEALLERVPHASESHVYLLHILAEISQ